MILIIVAALIGHRLLGFLLPDASIESQVVPLVISVVISFFLIRGHSAARSYLAISLGLAALVSALGGGVLAVKHWWGFVFVLFVPVYAWGAWALWSSPKVEAYIEYRERRRNPDMSFTDA